MSAETELQAAGRSALKTEELNRLRACESDIERGGQVIVASLMEIRDQRLYRADGYGDFDSYCKERWSMSKTHANRLLRHGAVLDVLTADSDLAPIGAILTEAATREIADLEPEKQRSVVREVTRSGQKPTAKAVRIAREKISPKETSPRQQVEDYFKDRGPDSSPRRTSIVLDQIGRPIPEHLLEKHNAAPLFMALARKLTAVLREAEELADGPGSEHFDITGFHGDVKRLQGELKDAAYWSACPRCDGSGCARCKSTGFLPGKMKGMLSAEDKVKLGLN